MFGWFRHVRGVDPTRSSDLVTVARAEATARGDEYVDTGHLLLALCRLTERPGWRAIAACGLLPEQVRAAILRIQPPGLQWVYPGEIPLTPRVQQAMRLAADYAGHLGHPAVEPEHVLVACLGDPESLAYAVLVDLGVRPRHLGLAVVQEAGWPPPRTSSA